MVVSWRNGGIKFYDVWIVADVQGAKLPICGAAVITSTSVSYIIPIFGISFYQRKAICIVLALPSPHVACRIAVIVDVQYFCRFCCSKVGHFTRQRGEGAGEGRLLAIHIFDDNTHFRHVISRGGRGGVKVGEVGLHHVDDGDFRLYCRCHIVEEQADDTSVHLDVRVAAGINAFDDDIGEHVIAGASWQVGKCADGIAATCQYFSRVELKHRLQVLRAVVCPRIAGLGFECEVGDMDLVVVAHILADKVEHHAGAET